MNLKFSDYFNLSKDIMNKYNLYDISIISDSPIFVDPFLLYVSDKPEYQSAHDELIRYILFLSRKVKSGENPQDIKKKFFYFKEPKQNWFGFSRYKNSGRGLNKKFANKFYDNLVNHMEYVESEFFGHIEELIIFDEGFGKDSISDFSTKLLLPFLLANTERFAKENIDPSLCKKFKVKKAYFDYTKEKWCDKEYYLPCYENDFIILTPKDILIEGDNFISRNDFLRKLSYGKYTVLDDKMRDHVNQYLSDIVNEELSAKQRTELSNKLLMEHPELISQYVKDREANSEEAIESNKKYIEKIESILDENLSKISNVLETETKFYEISNDSESNVLKKLSVLKSCLVNYRNDLFFLNNRYIGNGYASVIINRLWNGNRDDAFKPDFRFTYNSPISKTLNSYSRKNAVLCYISFNEFEIQRFNEAKNKSNAEINIVHFEIVE